MSDTDTSAEAVEAFIQGPIKEGVISEGLPRTAEDTATDYKTVDLLRALLAERERYKARAERAEDRIKDWIELASHVSIEAGVCCCGDDMENHSNPMDCGHSPVDHGSYMADLLVEDARATLAQIDAEPAEPRQPTVQEAARALLKTIPYNEDAIEAVQTKTRPTDFIASLRALAEGDTT